MTRSIAIAALMLFTASAAAAAPPARDQGDWPCRQIKVPTLSLAAVWSGPPIDSALKAWRDDAVVSELVPRLAARRTPIETAEKLVAEFAQGAGAARKERLTMLFAGSLTRSRRNAAKSSAALIAMAMRRRTSPGGCASEPTNCARRRTPMPMRKSSRSSPRRCNGKCGFSKNAARRLDSSARRPP